MAIEGLVIVACGAFSICGAAFDWNWFMENRKARVFVWLLGRTGARVVYALLGAVLVVMGVVLALTGGPR